MKKIGLFIAALLIGAPVAEAYDLFISTNVTTNVSNYRLTQGRGALKRVIVGKAGTGSTLDIWDGASSSVNLRKIASLDTATTRQIDLDVYISSGIAFTTAGSAAATVQIIYKAGQ